MANNPDRRTCACGTGKVSAWDGKCGHCRTKREKIALDALRNPHTLRPDAPSVSALSAGNRALVTALQDGDPAQWATNRFAPDTDKPVAMTVGLLERLLNAARHQAHSAGWSSGERSAYEHPRGEGG